MLGERQRWPPGRIGVVFGSCWFANIWWTNVGFRCRVKAGHRRGDLLRGTTVQLTSPPSSSSSSVQLNAVFSFHFVKLWSFTGDPVHVVALTERESCACRNHRAFTNISLRSEAVIIMIYCFVIYSGHRWTISLWNEPVFVCDRGPIHSCSVVSCSDQSRSCRNDQIIIHFVVTRLVFQHLTQMHKQKSWTHVTMFPCWLYNRSFSLSATSRCDRPVGFFLVWFYTLHTSFINMKLFYREADSRQFCLTDQSCQIVSVVSVHDSAFR